MQTMRLPGDRETVKRVGVAGPYAYLARVPGEPGFVQVLTDGHATPHPSQFRPDREASFTIEWNGRQWEQVH